MRKYNKLKYKYMYHYTLCIYLQSHLVKKIETMTFRDLKQLNSLDHLRSLKVTLSRDLKRPKMLFCFVVLSLRRIDSRHLLET